MPGKKFYQNFIYFSSVGMEMAIIIGVFAYAGYRLDKHFGNQTPWWTAFLSLTGVFASIYRVIVQVNQWAKGQK